MRQLLLICFPILFLACTNTELESRVKSLEEELTTAKAELTEVKNAKPAVPGLVHSVFFWLKEGISPADKSAFLAGVNSLKKISSVKNCYIGPPAPTEARGVVDNSFSYALIVHFDDVAGHDAYQVDPIHLKFVEEQQDKWTKVVVYDNVLGD